MDFIQLHPKRERRLTAGHQWIFSNEIAEIKGAPEAGDVVQVRRTDGHHLGYAYYHPHSLIAGRLLTRDRAVPDAAFYADRIRAALALRARRYPDAQALRLVHSESDGLPGLVIDRFGSAVVIQVVCAGAERHLDWILDAVNEQVAPDTIVLRNDNALRTLEGLALEVKTVKGDAATAAFEENGLTYEIDLLGGQKTGFYADQRENRVEFGRYVRAGDRVLDAFCNEGGFALHAARAGAAEVVAVDSSKPALDRAKANADRNGLAGIRFEARDVMDWLPALPDEGAFDVINLDPPSFAKNKKMAGAALKGYRKLHEAAIRALKPGGILATAKCSHHIESERFYGSLLEAAGRLDREVRLLHRAGQPADHPVDPAMPETEYLAFYIVRVS
jgi:23S rRNA (cytosine1962-C5)-methyltransferase